MGEADGMEIQQSEIYMSYIRSLGWSTSTVDGVRIIYRRIPMAGTIVKIQRNQKLPDIRKLSPVLKQIRATTLAIEPDRNISSEELKRYLGELKHQGYAINRSPFLPTKTILIDTAVSEDDIFARFAESKRRSVRKAIKNGVRVTETDDPDSVITTKNRSAGFLGFITTYGIRKLWNLLPKGARTGLVATHPDEKLPLACIMMVFHEGTGYYWIAGSTKKGKKLHAPTLLVWEALKLSRVRGMKQFDFVGVFDDRLPKENRQWLGFTRFKEGFGGTPVTYPIAR